MLGVIVEFDFGDDFDRARLERIAHEARGQFERMRGLRVKAFTVDESGRRATNVYLWHSAEAARAFFTDERLERIAGLYGVRPTVTFVDAVEVVDNG